MSRPQVKGCHFAKKKLVAKRRSSVKFVPDKEVMDQLKEKDLLFDSEGSDSDFE